ncbi:MAG: hypothetical protein LBH44_12075 [Treponema sp.]|nr:hypothetical protein [Treponema sp.]
MADVIREKEKLTEALSDQYSRSVISLDEYEQMIDKVNKIDSEKELRAFQKQTGINNDLTLPAGKGEEIIAIFSWRSTDVKPVNGNAGNFVCVFGTNQIKVSDLPKGKTVMNVESIFGLTEIYVSKKIRVITKATPVMGGIFAPVETEDADTPELHITGTAVFGNITIIRT